MSRGTHRLSRLLAATAALSLGVGGVPLAPVAVPGNVTAPTPAKQNGVAVVAQAPVARVETLRRIGRNFDGFQNQGFIWLGRAKRGNRRGRTRWDYNR